MHLQNSPLQLSWFASTFTCHCILMCPFPPTLCCVPSHINYLFTTMVSICDRIKLRKKRFVLAHRAASESYRPSSVYHSRTMARATHIRLVRKQRLAGTFEVPSLEAYFHLLGPTPKRLLSLPEQQPQLGMKYEPTGDISGPMGHFISPQPCSLVFWQIKRKVELGSPIILFPLRTKAFLVISFLVIAELFQCSS